MDDLYVLSRKTLLDALEALDPHRASLTLVGAHAVYLRVGEIEGLAVPPFTSDADLAVHPQLLAVAPPMEDSLRGAGFLPRGGDAVGVWVATQSTRAGAKVEIPLDLLVPDAFADGKRRRAVDLRGHDSRVARRVVGLEGALIDRDERALPALDATDGRRVVVGVAGEAALLIAKLHKLNERSGSARQSAKDALDVLRLLRGSSTAELARRWKTVFADPRARQAAQSAQGFLRALFGTATSAGSRLAADSVRGLADPDEVRNSCSMLAEELLAELPLDA